MDGKILEFAALLRKAGVKVSHSEVAESLQSLSMVGLEKQNFYHCLAATLIKDHADYPVFDKLFDYYFEPGFFGHRDKALERWPNLILPFREKTTAGCRGDDAQCSTGDDQGRSTGFGQGQGLATAAADNFIRVIKAGNPEEMAGWLNSDLLIHSERPVELRRGVLCGTLFQFHESNRGKVGHEFFISKKSPKSIRVVHMLLKPIFLYNR